MNRIPPRPARLLAALLAGLICLSSASAARSAPEAIKTPANVMCEARFESARPHADPFNDLTLDVVFTAPDGSKRRVPAFWDGGKVWKVRYASGLVGNHTFRSVCSDADDPGLNGVEGSVAVEPYHGDNPLYAHGPIRIAADHRHFEYADGAPFLWLGDTWWMGLCKRLGFPDEFKTLAADRKAKGFNVIQIVAGLYPDQGAFDPRGENESGFAWEKDYARIRPAYFDAADARIEYLVDQGFSPCIVGAWGFHMPWLGVAKMKQHLRYVAARWGALPVTWCGAGEFDLPFYKSPGFPRIDEKQAADWAEAFAYLREVNAFDRPITAHPTGIPPLSGRLVLRQVVHSKNDRLLDFDMLQTGHGGVGVLAPTLSALRDSLAITPPTPVVEGEVAYEALNGSISAEICRLMCWECFLNGAAGHTYGANGIWQLNREGDPYGNSPWGGSYGPIPWDKSMHLPGSAQVGYAARLLRSLPFEKFEPRPQWVHFKAGADHPVDKRLVPAAAGVPRVVRVIYAPAPAAIVVSGLEPDVRYKVRRFDPATGESQEIPNLSASGPGDWSCDPPPNATHDWALVLEADPAGK